MVSFVFTFDRSDKIYKAGDTVHCKIQISVFSKFKARSLTIRYKGIAHTEWTKSRTVTRNGKSHTVHDRYTGDEEYFRHYQYMFGSAHSSEQEVTPGTHTYNISFVLPQNIPTSVEHHNGHIRYNVKAKYDIPWGFDSDGTASFYVISTTDLNEFNYLREPVRQGVEKIFGCCCCESDPMKLTNALPKTGFVPGETIPITIEIDNNSDVRIDFVRVKFKEHITFITRSPRTDTRTDTNTINQHFFQTAVAPFQKKVFQTTFYLDPSYDFKIFNGCGIINSEYYIKSEAEASGCHSNPDNSTRIVIGTIPFNDNYATNGTFDAIAPAILAPTAPAIFDPTAKSNGVISEQPLPSYNDLSSPGPSGAVGWNIGLKSPSGAPMASTEKVHLDDDTAPPSFEESQKNPSIYPGHASKAEEAGETTPLTPSAPAEPTASATAPPE